MQTLNTLNTNKSNQERLSSSSLTSHTLNSTAPDVLHHRHAEKGSGAYAILDLCRFQDSVVTNQKSVRVRVLRKMLAYHIILRIRWKYRVKQGMISEQELAITYFIRGNDVFVSLPTGYSKSLCFALLPSVLKGVEKASIVLVISPLISIITDQVASFCAKGITAAFAGCKWDKAWASIR